MWPASTYLSTGAFFFLLMKFDNQISASWAAAHHSLLSLLEQKLKRHLKNDFEQEFISNISNRHFFLRSHLGMLNLTSSWVPLPLSQYLWFFTWWLFSCLCREQHGFKFHHFYRNCLYSDTLHINDFTCNWNQAIEIQWNLFPNMLKVIY